MRLSQALVVAVLALGVLACDGGGPTESELDDLPTGGTPPTGPSGSGGATCTALQCVRIHGLVLDDYTNRPIAGATVIAIGNGIFVEAQSNERGVYDFGWTVPIGEQLELSASRSGYTTYTASVSSHYAINVGVRMVADTIVAADIIGHVRAGPNWDPAVPLAGAIVRLRSGLNNFEGTVLDSVVVDATGSYRFAMVPPGPVSITIDAPGYASSRSSGMHSTARPTLREAMLLEAPFEPYEFTLTWQDRSQDLDLRVWTPSTGWLGYENPGRCDAAPWVCLDVDDRTGATGERFRVARHVDAYYVVSVVDYDDVMARRHLGTDLSRSGARLVLREGSNTIRADIAAPMTGVGTTWHVLRAIGRGVENASGIRTTVIELPAKQ